MRKRWSDNQGEAARLQQAGIPQQVIGKLSRLQKDGIPQQVICHVLCHVIDFITYVKIHRLIIY